MELEAEILREDDDGEVRQLFNNDLVEQQRLSYRVRHRPTVDRDGEGAGRLVVDVGRNGHEEVALDVAVMYVDGVRTGNVLLDLGENSSPVADT